MKLTNYDFHLPERLIARFPEQNRDDSRLLVVDRQRNEFRASTFRELPQYFNEGDCLVLNDTKVYPARLYAQSEKTGRKHQFLLLSSLGHCVWKVIYNKTKKCSVGDQFRFQDDLTAELIEKFDGGVGQILFNREVSYQELHDIGNMALPPYILKLRDLVEEDKTRYQTVYSNEIGSIAAPTAGLHFTDDILDRLKKKE